MGAEASSRSCGVDVYLCRSRPGYLSSGIFTERTRRRRPCASDSQPEGDLRSIVPANILIGAGDRGYRMAAAAKFCRFGTWHPTRSTPFPPACSRYQADFGEILFWSERTWAQELDRSSHHCRLFKVRLACWLERYHVQRCLRYPFGAVVVSASASAFTAAHDLYFHRVSSVIVAEHRCEALLRNSRRRCNARVVGLWANQRRHCQHRYSNCRMQLNG